MERLGIRNRRTQQLRKAGIITVFIAVIFLFMQTSVNAAWWTTSDNKSEIIQFLEEHSNWLQQSDGIFDTVIRKVAWLIVKALYNLALLFEGFMSQALKLLDWTESSGLSSLYDGLVGEALDGFVWVLLVIAIIWLAIKVMIMKARPDFKSYAVNLVIAVILILGLPQIISQLNTLATDFVNGALEAGDSAYEDEIGEETSSVGSISWSVVSQNIADLVYVGSNGFESISNDADASLSKHALTKDSFKNANLSTVLTASTIDDADIDNPKFEYLRYALDNDGVGNTTTYEMSSSSIAGLLSDSLSPGYFRYPLKFWTIVFTLLPLCLAYIFTAYCMLKTIFELGIKNTYAVLVVATDLETGERTKQIVKDILMTYAGLGFSVLMMQIYTIWVSYSGSYTGISDLVRIMSYIAGTGILVAGSTTVMKHFGVDTGFSKPLNSLMGVVSSLTGAYRHHSLKNAVNQNDQNGNDGGGDGGPDNSGGPGSGGGPDNSGGPGSGGGQDNGTENGGSSGGGTKKSTSTGTSNSNVIPLKAAAGLEFTNDASSGIDAGNKDTGSDNGKTGKENMSANAETSNANGQPKVSGYGGYQSSGNGNGTQNSKDTVGIDNNEYLATSINPGNMSGEDKEAGANAESSLKNDGSNEMSVGNGEMSESSIASTAKTDSLSDKTDKSIPDAKGDNIQPTGTFTNDQNKTDNKQGTPSNVKGASNDEVGKPIEGTDVSSNEPGSQKLSDITAESYENTPTSMSGENADAQSPNGWSSNGPEMENNHNIGNVGQSSGGNDAGYAAPSSKPADTLQSAPPSQSMDNMQSASYGSNPAEATDPSSVSAYSGDTQRNDSGSNPASKASQESRRSGYPENGHYVSQAPESKQSNSVHSPVFEGLENINYRQTQSNNRNQSKKGDRK